MIELDPSTRDLAKGQAKVAAQAVARNLEAPRVLPDPIGVPPSVREAQSRRAARARQATVARWLRRLSA